MKLDSTTIKIEMEIFQHCKSESEKLSYVFEAVKNAGEMNRSLPAFLFDLAEANWTEFSIGFLVALKLVSEQELLNQENELERIFHLQ